MKNIANLTEFNQILATSTAIINFTATWCGPCKVMKPLFLQLESRHPTVQFCSVDVDAAKDVAAHCKVASMPTFMLYRDGLVVDTVLGANKAALEQLLKKASPSGASAAKKNNEGYSDLAGFVNLQRAECLNTVDAISTIISGTGELESDVDAQLVLHVPFNQSVRIHSIQLTSKNGFTN